MILKLKVREPEISAIEYNGDRATLKEFMGESYGTQDPTNPHELCVDPIDWVTHEKLEPSYYITLTVGFWVVKTVYPTAGPSFVSCSSEDLDRQYNLIKEPTTLYYDAGEQSPVESVVMWGEKEDGEIEFFEKQEAPNPGELIKEGDYVIGTKYSDGDSNDPWGVGFYSHNQADDGANPHYHRHILLDRDDNPVYKPGYRRVERVSREAGAILLAMAEENNKTLLYSEKSIWWWRDFIDKYISDRKIEPKYQLSQVWIHEMVDRFFHPWNYEE